MNMVAPQNPLKVVVIGNTGIGKTCFCRQFVERSYSPTYVPTQRYDVLSYTLENGGNNVPLSIWDLSGADHVRTLTTACYKDSQAAVICYSMTDQASYADVVHWFKNLSETLNDDARDLMEVVIVGLKCDSLATSISKEKGENLAETLGLAHFVTSAKANTGIEEVFTYIASAVMNRKEKKPYNKISQDYRSTDASESNDLVPRNGGYGGKSESVTNSSDSCCQACSSCVLM